MKLQHNYNAKVSRNIFRQYADRTLIRKFLCKQWFFTRMILLLLLPLLGMGQEIRTNDLMGDFEVRDEPSGVYIRANGRFYDITDTIPVTIEVQYLKRDLPGLRDCYLINGEPWYRSTAPLTRGKWIKIRAYRWKISEGWNVTKNK